jgi:hypothetical protein
VGGGTLCTAEATLSSGPEVTDAPCPSFAVYDTSTVVESKTRWYDTDGNLTRRLIRDHYTSGQWSNPLTGDSVDYTQNNVQWDVLADPGDLTSATQTITGQVHVRGDSGPPLLIATGRQVFNFDESVLLSSAGRNAFIDAFFRGKPNVFDDVCTALAQ